MTKLLTAAIILVIMISLAHGQTQRDAPTVRFYTPDGRLIATRIGR